MYAECVESLISDCGEEEPEPPDVSDYCDEKALADCTTAMEKFYEPELNCSFDDDTISVDTDMDTASGDEDFAPPPDEVSPWDIVDCCKDLDEPEMQDFVDCVIPLESDDCDGFEQCDEGFDDEFDNEGRDKETDIDDTGEADPDEDAGVGNDEENDQSSDEKDGGADPAKSDDSSPGGAKCQFMPSAKQSALSLSTILSFIF